MISKLSLKLFIKKKSDLPLYFHFLEEVVDWRWLSVSALLVAPPPVKLRSSSSPAAAQDNSSPSFTLNFIQNGFITRSRLRLQR